MSSTLLHIAAAVTSAAAIYAYKTRTTTIVRSEIEQEESVSRRKRQENKAKYTKRIEDQFKSLHRGGEAYMDMLKSFETSNTANYRTVLERTNDSMNCTNEATDKLTDVLSANLSESTGETIQCTFSYNKVDDGRFSRITCNVCK